MHIHTHTHLEAERRVADVWQQARGTKADLNQRVDELAQRRVGRLGQRAEHLRDRSSEWR